MKPGTVKSSKRKKEGFATRREALEWEKTVLGTCKTDVTMTFETLVGKYMADCEARLEPTSVMHKEYIINTKLLPYFGKMQLNEITVTTVRQWQNTLITHPVNYSPTYLKSIHNQLSAIMNFAVKFYGLAKKILQPSAEVWAKSTRTACCSGRWMSSTPSLLQ